MKYVIVIADGISDLPVPELDGRTPLQAARTPVLDHFARSGRVGTVATTHPADEDASLATALRLAGIDPAEMPWGVSAIEAFGAGAEPPARTYRVEFCQVNAAGALHLPSHRLIWRPPSAAFAQLVTDLGAHLMQQAPDVMAGRTLLPFAEGRAVLVEPGADLAAMPDIGSPEEASRRSWEDVLLETDGPGAECAHLMRLAAAFLSSCPQPGREQQFGAVWIWSHGVLELHAAKEECAPNVLALVKDPHLVAAGRCAGWHTADPRNLGDDFTVDLKALSVAVMDALGRHDMVVCEVDAVLRATERGDFDAKVAAIESIDRDLVAPVLDRLSRFGDPATDPSATGWRLLVHPRRAAYVSTRVPERDVVPFVMGGAWVRSVVSRSFDEVSAAASDLHIDPGHEFFEYFVKGGLARIRA
ncbi:MAG: hypothetical protein KF866_00320 [Phycisphaeraceae bacterium]|nr:hypothetical protein [Phycisphaeraceae bacterium]